MSWNRLPTSGNPRGPGKVVSGRPDGRATDGTVEGGVIWCSSLRTRYGVSHGAGGCAHRPGSPPMSIMLTIASGHLHGARRLPPRPHAACEHPPGRGVCPWHTAATHAARRTALWCVLPPPPRGAAGPIPLRHVWPQHHGAHTPRGSHRRWRGVRRGPASYPSVEGCPRVVSGARGGTGRVAYRGKCCCITASSCLIRTRSTRR